nr:hypothetical protein 8 [bacterium]
MKCRWCEKEFYPEELTIDGFCSAKCELEWAELNGDCFVEKELLEQVYGPGGD